MPLCLHLETRAEAEAGVAGLWVRLAAGAARVDAVEPRLLEEGGDLDDGPRPQHHRRVGAVRPHYQV